MMWYVLHSSELFYVINALSKSSSPCDDFAFDIPTENNNVNHKPPSALSDQNPPRQYAISYTLFV